MDDVQKRLRHQVQLTSDGHRPYSPGTVKTYRKRQISK